MPFTHVIPEHTINRFLLKYQLQRELSVCHLYVALILAHLHCLAMSFYNDFKLFCPNNKNLWNFSPTIFFSFVGIFTSSVISFSQAYHATLNRLLNFYGFLTILPLLGHFDAKDIRDTFAFPSANSLSLPVALLNACTLLGRSPEICWHDKMDYILRLLFQIPAIKLSDSAI